VWKFFSKCSRDEKSFSSPMRDANRKVFLASKYFPSSQHIVGANRIIDSHVAIAIRAGKFSCRESSMSARKSARLPARGNEEPDYNRTLVAAINQGKR
jgi:hypothetical protein